MKKLWYYMGKQLTPWEAVVVTFAGLDVYLLIFLCACIRGRGITQALVGVAVMAFLAATEIGLAIRKGGKNVGYYKNDFFDLLNRNPVAFNK